MGPSGKIVSKLARRSKSVKAKQRGEHDKEDKRQKTLRKSPRAYKLSRKEQRRMDSNWGQDILKQKPVLSFDALGNLARFDYGSGDYGMKLTLASGLESSIGLQAGDVVKLRSGRAKGHELLVVTLTDSTHIRLQDLPSYAIAGVKEITSITAVADVAGSLVNTYFNISTALDAAKYYVWFDDGGGVDPLVAGRTAVPIVYSDNATAATLGGLIRSALTGLGFSVAGTGANALVTNAATGATTDAADAGATGFTISVTQQGVTANATPSESGLSFRAYISSEKASYV